MGAASSSFSFPFALSLLFLIFFSLPSQLYTAFRRVNDAPFTNENLYLLEPKGFDCTGKSVSKKVIVAEQVRPIFTTLVPQAIILFLDQQALCAARLQRFSSYKLLLGFRWLRRLGLF